MNPDEKACPFCGETIKSVAIRCKHCQADLTSQQAVSMAAPSSTAIPAEPSEPKNSRQGSIPKAIGWTLILAGFMVIYYGGILGVLAFPVLWIGFTLVFPGSSLIVRTGKGFVAMILVLGVATAVIGGWRDVVEKGTNSGNVARPTQEVPIGALLSAYEGNELAADSQYKGKVIQTSGTLSSVSKDVLDKPYLLLEEPGKERLLRNVQCYLSEASLNDARQAKPGDTATVAGKVDGLLINVLLSDCVLIAKAQPSTSAAASLSMPKENAAAKEAERSISTSSSFLRAPSYDCSKASTPTEQGICSSAKLSLLDAMMAYQYRANLANARDKTAFASGHKVWVAKRNECGGDQTCLERIYLERLQGEIETAQVAEFFGSKGFSKGKDYPDGKRFCGTDYVKGSETIYVTTYCAGDGFYDIDVRR